MPLIEPTWGLWLASLFVWKIIGSAVDGVASIWSATNRTYVGTVARETWIILFPHHILQTNIEKRRNLHSIKMNEPLKFTENESGKCRSRQLLIDQAPFVALKCIVFLSPYTSFSQIFFPSQILLWQKFLCGFLLRRLKSVDRDGHRGRKKNPEVKI